MSIIYDWFAEVTSKIGLIGSTALAGSALFTNNPTRAFADLLDYTLHAIEHNVSLPNFSIDQFAKFFSEFIDAVEDADTSRYGQEVLLEKYALAMEYRDSKEGKDSFLTAYILNQPDQYVEFVYNSQGALFYVADIVGRGIDNDFWIFVLWESIRQQITQGRGLRCPLWNSHKNACCGARNLLEKVWSSTICDPACEHWQREGCLRI
jgi:hypothetical protein